jgi:Tat protein translocase TatC
VPGAAILLMLGVAFGYTVVVPYGLYFLVQLMNFGQVQPLVSVSSYFSLLFMLTAALGLVFQLPLVMLTLQKVGIVSHEALKKNWRYVILLVFVLAGVFSPPDPFTQVMMALPMVLLYILGLVLTGRSARRAKAENPTGAA